MIKSTDKSKYITNSSIQTHTRTRLLTVTALFAAMITIMTAYLFHVPVGANGGYIHFGDALIYLAAVLLPRPYAMAAAAIGGGMADLLTAPMWAPATVIIKMLITLPFTNRSDKIVTVRNVIASIIAFLISGTGYYLAETLLFGSKTAFLMSISGSCIQSGGSAIIFVLFGIVLDRMGLKKRFFKDN